MENRCIESAKFEVSRTLIFVAQDMRGLMVGVYRRRQQAGRLVSYRRYQNGRIRYSRPFGRGSRVLDGGRVEYALH